MTEKRAASWYTEILNLELDLDMSNKIKWFFYVTNILPIFWLTQKSTK
jgi:hypothetical protein